MNNDLIEESRRHIDKMVAALVSHNDGPLQDAYIACLEAASAVGRAIERSAVDGERGTSEAATEDVHEALHASRAASASIRFSLFAGSDRATGKSRASTHDPGGPY